MTYPAIIDGSFFYSQMLPSIDSEFKRQCALQILEEMRESLDRMKSYMKQNKVFFPRYYNQLKHSIEMLRIYEIDI